MGYNTFTTEKYQDAAARAFETCNDMDGILGVDMAAAACMREAAVTEEEKFQRISAQLRLMERILQKSDQKF